MTPNEQAALWRELAARLPGLEKQAHICPAHQPDLALLLRAAREAGYRYKLAWSGKGYVVQFMRGEWIPPVFDYPDELTAAMLAVKRALDAEKERNHD